LTNYNSIKEKKMKLVLQKNQKSGFTKIIYVLEAKVELTDDEKKNIQKYKIGKTLLFTNMADRGSGVAGMVSRALMGIEITVNDLVNGKKIEVKDFFQMFTMEDQIKEACKNFKAILDAMASFGGDEIIEY
jgi:hypothetical protein